MVHPGSRIVTGRGRGAALVFILLLAGSGCATTFDATRLGVPVTMAAPAGPIPEGAEFRITKRSLHGLFGLISLSQPSLKEALAAQLVGGQGIANMRIRVRSRWSDLLITLVTLGLLAPRSVTFEGVVVNP